MFNHYVNKKKTRILQVIESLGRGGAERLLVSNLSKIDALNFENTVVFLFENDSLRREMEILGVKVYSLALRNKYQFFRAISLLRTIIKENRIDLIHTHCLAADIYGRLAGFLEKVKVISSIHDSTYEPQVLIDTPRYNLFKLSLTKWLDYLTGKMSVSRYIAVSGFVKESTMKHLGIKPEKISVIYNSIDPGYFVPGNGSLDEKENIKSKFNINFSDKVLLTVGRLVPMKGQKYMIMSMKEIVDRRRDVKLLIRGTGWMKDKLISLRDKLGLNNYVYFIEPQDDIRSLFEIADIFLFSSLHEGLGIAQLEAMAMKKPVVAFAVGPIPEVVADGVSGLLVKPWDVSKLALAILSILDDEARMKRMGEAGRSIVEEKFNINKNIKQLEGLYRSLENDF